MSCCIKSATLKALKLVLRVGGVVFLESMMGDPQDQELRLLMWR
jgi:hypothetical protein